MGCCCCSSSYVEPGPRTAPGVAFSGKPRICMAGMMPSHNTGRCKMVFDAVTREASDRYDTWWMQFPRSGSSPYYAFVEELKAELPPAQQEAFGTRKGWSSPFVWLEMPDGSRNAIGGRDRFSEWAAAEFADNAAIVQAASKPAGAFDWTLDSARPGTLPGS